MLKTRFCRVSRAALLLVKELRYTPLTRLSVVFNEFIWVVTAQTLSTVHGRHMHRAVQAGLWREREKKARAKKWDGRK